MGRFIIEGGRSLSGSVRVGGSKNAALPVIFATLSTRGVSKISGLSEIGDVRVALRLIEEQGAVVERRGGITLINTETLEYKTPSPALVSLLRASTYLIGSTLARFGRAEIGAYGGCSFSHRPIDLHILAAERLGARLSGCELTAPGLFGCDLSFPKRSVGATVNFLIMAASAEGESTLRGCATEGHIDTLIEYLRSCGAEIEREGDTVRVRGAQLGGGCVSIPGDPIEAGTYISASLATRGRVRVEGVSELELMPLLELLADAGATVETTDGITVTGELNRPIEVVATAHPGFPTDLQPLTAPLMARFFGGSIEDRVWRDRYGYLRELARLGVCYRISDRGAEIYPSELSSGSALATDLRGGAACIIASLAARGECEVLSAHTVERGYERLCEKISSIGGKIIYSEL